jgi:hypothetical protein
MKTGSLPTAVSWKGQDSQARRTRQRADGNSFGKNVKPKGKNSQPVHPKFALLWSTDPGEHTEQYRTLIDEKKAAVWGADMNVSPKSFSVPAPGFLYINKDKVRYKAIIGDIEHYDNAQLPREPDFRPESMREKKHKTFLRLKSLEPLKRPRNITEFKRLDQKHQLSSVKVNGLQNCVKVLLDRDIE